MSGSSPLKAASIVLAEISARAASAFRPATHSEKSARAVADATEAFHAPIIRDSCFPVETARLALE
jgi:hypothetical protein